jgi:hypothetical protein
MTEALAESPELTNEDLINDPDLELAVFPDEAAGAHGFDVSRDIPEQGIADSAAREVAISDDTFMMLAAGDGSMIALQSKEYLADRAKPKRQDRNREQIKLDTTSKLPQAFIATGFEDVEELNRQCEIVLGSELFAQVLLHAAKSNVAVYRHLQQALYFAMQQDRLDVSGGINLVNGARVTQRDENPDHPHFRAVKTILNPDNFGRLIDKCRNKEVGNVAGLRAGVANAIAKKQW